MTYTIQNELLSVSIQHKGAEICSIKSQATQQEYMWNADPDIWGSYAPVLFPIIGALKDGGYTYKGRSYSVPKHGFIRHNNDLEVHDHTEDSITLKYSSNEELLKAYPFRFEFYITFKLEGSVLSVHHKIINLGDEEMLFSLGGHPAFKCPFNYGEVYEDYFIEFEEEETDVTWKISNNGLTTGNTESVLNTTHKLPLTKDIFNEDALIFKNLKSRKVALKNIHNNSCIKVNFPDFNYLGIWAKPNAPFVCIEPWLGITDDENTTGDFEQKEGIIKLAAKETYQAEFSVEVVEE